MAGASRASPDATTRTAVGELLGPDVLEQEAARARSHGFVDVLVGVERGQHEHSRLAAVGQEAAGRFQAVHLRHADVHQDNVRSEAARLRECVLAVLRFADYLDVLLGIEDQAEAAAHERLVVGDQHADHRGVGSTGRWARMVKPPSGRRPASSWPP
jgi:hypothetical protein